MMEQHNLESKLKLFGRNKKYTPSTVKLYIAHIYNFLSHFNINKNDLESISINMIIGYIKDIEGKYSINSLNNIISALSFLAMYLERAKWIDEIKTFRKRREKIDLEFLSKSEVVNFLSMIDNLKYKLIFMLMYSIGLKGKEVSRIRLKDVDFKTRKIFIRGNDKKVDRNLNISEKTLSLIYTYIRDNAIVIENEILFRGKFQNQPLSDRSIQKKFNEYIDKAEIKKNISPKALRISYMIHMLEKGICTKVLSKTMGYADIKYVNQYLKYVDNIVLESIV